MTAGPATEVTEPAETGFAATVSTIVAQQADEMLQHLDLPIAVIPLRPRRRHRPRRVVQVTWSTDLDGKTDSKLYIQLPAAHRHAARLCQQGYPAVVTVGAISSWSVVGR